MFTPRTLISFFTLPETKHIAYALAWNYVMIYGFDYFLYPYAMVKMGNIRGAALMWVASFILCYLFIALYDVVKSDWLGVESLKDIENDTTRQDKLARALRAAARNNEWLTLFLLSLRFDAFFVTIALRKGAHQYNGMKWPEWKLFIASFLVSNGYWTMFLLGGFKIFKIFFS